LQFALGYVSNREVQWLRGATDFFPRSFFIQTLLSAPFEVLFVFGFFQVCVGYCYFVVLVCHVCLEVFFEVWFESGEEFLGDGQVTACVLVNVFASLVTFFEGDSLIFTMPFHSVGFFSLKFNPTTNNNFS
jgi:hypothetical protein